VPTPDPRWSTRAWLCTQSTWLRWLRPSQKSSSPNCRQVALPCSMSLWLLLTLAAQMMVMPLQDVGGAIDHTTYAAALAQLLGYQPRVVHLAAGRLAEVWHDIAAIAEALQTEQQGRQLVADLQQRLRAAALAAKGRTARRVLCIQWHVSGPKGVGSPPGVPALQACHRSVSVGPPPAR
jgi:hypothetical protein